MKRSLLVTAILLICFGRSYSQNLNIGLRFESIYYFIDYKTHTEEFVFPLPFSAYIKAGTEYQKFGLDIKGGVQWAEKFFGTEYGLELKYNITENFAPFIAYLLHYNGSEDYISSWIIKEPLNFAGFGIEAKLTKLFGLDLTFYFPVGNKAFEYEQLFYDPSTTILVSRMGPVIKLGFIFDIVRI